jgi:hypothetical protein
MYVQMTFSDIPGATEKGMLDLLLPFVKNMKYKALLIMTTKDKNIHVLVRFHEPGRKDHLMERFVRNVYSKFALPPGKKATDYVSIGHKMKESDYMDIAEVLFNDQWGPAPGVETLEDVKRGLLELEKWLEPHLDRIAKLRNRITELEREEKIGDP